MTEGIEIAAANLRGPLVEDGVGFEDLVKIKLKPEMVAQVEVGIEAIPAPVEVAGGGLDKVVNVIRVTGIGDREVNADLEVRSAGCGRDRLPMGQPGGQQHEGEDDKSLPMRKDHLQLVVPRELYVRNARECLVANCDREAIDCCVAQQAVGRGDGVGVGARQRRVGVRYGSLAAGPALLR